MILLRLNSSGDHNYIKEKHFPSLKWLFWDCTLDLGRCILKKIPWGFRHNLPLILYRPLHENMSSNFCSSRHYYLFCFNWLCVLWVAISARIISTALFVAMYFFVCVWVCVCMCVCVCVCVHACKTFVLLCVLIATQSAKDLTAFLLLPPVMSSQHELTNQEGRLCKLSVPLYLFHTCTYTHTHTHTLIYIS